ncbi:MULTISPECIES: hypothetical protein [unclassified Rhodococcus (in: high G+C Gram-positive bacteria)]|uniref:hypothetical protein n=1 Tax=unclassified Rhodococcus (in: high G+C Gram-positive bacteria) TaxID=192944 RepID=UPI0024B65742|nr:MULTISPECIES: hypothetical protein [unclassified Rhodococcus (in: high G+C Gram-positive bacteria)]MDI9954377.1 hypothetical protein [Rhodococcus sp. IEGM 1305]MDI9973712.1 hypothetical protein [Rhodococcus sp. IEGM 1307]
MRLLPQRSLVYMRTLASEHPDPIAQHPAALDPPTANATLDDALIGRLAHFLSDFGAPFSSVGRQHEFSVGNSDFYLEVGRGRSLVSFAGRSAAVYSAIRIR